MQRRKTKKANTVKISDKRSAAALQTLWLLRATNKSIKRVLGRQGKLDSLPVPQVRTLIICY